MGAPDSDDDDDAAAAAATDGSALGHAMAYDNEWKYAAATPPSTPPLDYDEYGGSGGDDDNDNEYRP